MRDREWGPLLDDAVRRLRGAGVDSPRLNAELLLAHALRVRRLDVLTRSDAARRHSTPAALRRFRALLARRARRVPLQHLTGAAEFFGRPFRVTSAVLVPRPETETLVQRALDHLHANRKPETVNRNRETGNGKPGTGNREPVRVLDLGTGSGAIAVTVACECPGAEVVATDRSRAALAVARSNARRLGVAGRVRFLAGDLFEALPVGGAFDLVLSNPPYVSTADLARCQPEVRDHEPRLATWGGPDGLAVIRRLVAEAPAFLAPGGALMMEVGAGQAGRVARLLRTSRRYAAVRVTKDLAGIGRVVEGIP